MVSSLFVAFFVKRTFTEWSKPREGQDISFFAGLKKVYLALNVFLAKIVKTSFFNSYFFQMCVCRNSSAQNLKIKVSQQSA